MTAFLSLRTKIAREYVRMVETGTLPKVAVNRLVKKYKIHRATIYRNVRRVRDEANTAYKR